MKLFYLFIDGIGLGSKNADQNPFTRYASSALLPLGDPSRNPEIPGMIMVPTDTHMGIDGLPQSATGQTALWTGLNAPKIQGHHLTALPGPTLARVIHEYSIIKIFRQFDKKATLINAYSSAYMEKLAQNPRLASVSTHMQIASEQPPLSLDDLEKGQAIYMDITHEIMHRMNPRLKERFPVRDAKERGREFVRMGRNYDLVIFEYFITDKAGHDQSWSMSSYAISRLESFIEGIADEMDTNNELLLITSDHGNMEDLSVKTHTHNPVPTLLLGEGSLRGAEEIEDLTHIPRFIYSLFDMDVPLEEEQNIMERL